MKIHTFRGDLRDISAKLAIVASTFLNKVDIPDVLGERADTICGLHWLTGRRRAIYCGRHQLIYLFSLSN